MEILLQKLLFDDKDSFVCDAYYRETLTKQLKKQQFLVRQRVGLVFNSGIQKITHKQSGKAGKYQGSCENRIQVHEIRAADADTYRLHTEGI